MEKTKESPTTRELALEWWYKLDNQAEVADKYYLGHITIQNHQIEEIWKKETKDGSDREIIESVIKPNKKQYKEFSPELFKAYISKFSDDDKLKALSILEKSIPLRVLIERELKKLEE